jgi:hypothetical protein
VRKNCPSEEDVLQLNDGVREIGCPGAPATTVGRANSWGLPACFEAARMRQKAKIFHELDHNTLKIAPLLANASSGAAQALARKGY